MSVLNNVLVFKISEQIIIAAILYDKGADYVLMSHLTASHYLGKAISRNSSLQFLLNLKNRDKQLMQKDECWLL